MTARDFGRGNAEPVRRCVAFAPFWRRAPGSPAERIRGKPNSEPDYAKDHLRNEERKRSAKTRSEEARSCARPAALSGLAAQKKRPPDSRPTSGGRDARAERVTFMPSVCAPRRCSVPGAPWRWCTPTASCAMRTRLDLHRFRVGSCARAPGRARHRFRRDASQTRVTSPWQDGRTPAVRPATKKGKPRLEVPLARGRGLALV
jgi:hypothetical protein